MKRRVRFELCGKRGGYYVRFIAGNGREVWRTSETYIERKDALHAVEVLLGHANMRSTEGRPVFTFIGVIGAEILDCTDKALAAKESAS